MSFEEAYEEFKIYASKRHKKQGFDTLIRNFNSHIFPYFVNRNISELTKIDIVNWQNDILCKNFSNSFNNSLYCAFNSFLNYCIIYSYISFNPLKEVGRFKKKVEVKKYEVYTLHEFRKFRSAIDNIIYKYFFSFMFFYGTRPSETIALKFSDFNGFYVTISHNIHRRGNRSLDTPKNQSSIRTFNIGLLTYFRILLLKRYYIKIFGYCSFDFFVFGGIKPLSTTTIDRIKHKACIKKNIHEITQHQFRHSFATRMIHKKIPIDIVSRQMGHSRVSTTLDVYLHHEKRSIWHYSLR